MNALDLLYVPVALATSPLWAFKKRQGWSERFGRTPRLPPPPTGKKGRVLLHAVSVGEVGALRHLVPLLTSSHDVVISATTDTGLKRARELFAGSCGVARYPLDFSGSVGSFLDAVRPDVVALVELEVWPNFIRACGARRIPVGVINGRLSARSFRGYRKIRRLLLPTFRSLAFVAAQDRDYRDRFEHLGVAPERLSIAGSMKWDSAKIEDSVPGADQLAAELGLDRARPIVVAGSTGPGEEALLHRAVGPDVQLVCAPRKPERFVEAAAAMPGCVRRTQSRGNSQFLHNPSTGTSKRFLLDTIGELRAAYALADVVVIGRSFLGMYGSDPIEAIALGKATVIGPHVTDFSAVVEAFESAGGIVRTTDQDLGSSIAELLGDPTRRQRLAETGRRVIRENMGASERHARLLTAQLVAATNANKLQS